jgi:Coenzyme PQQ synthesis protein D (PqqD)
MTAQSFADQSVTYRVDDARTAWREVGSEAVVLDLGTSTYFGLNRSAGVLWPRLLAGCTYIELIDSLINEARTPLPSQQAAAEVSTFLAAVDAEKMLITTNFAK